MNIAHAIESGITGATTLSLIQEALHKIDTKAPRPLLHKSGVIKKLKKHAGKKGGDVTKLYIKLAGELLAAASYFGLTRLGRKKNAVLRGGLLGATAGLASAFLFEEDRAALQGQENHTDSLSNDDEALKRKILTVVMYTAGGMLAGAAIRKVDKKRLKKISKGLKKKK